MCVQSCTQIGAPFVVYHFETNPPTLAQVEIETRYYYYNVVNNTILIIIFVILLVNSNKLQKRNNNHAVCIPSGYWNDDDF